MRVLVLGGAGDMGSSIVRFLAEDGRVSEVVIGDVNMAGARRRVEELGGLADKVGVVRVDIWGGEVASIIRGFDSVVGAVGPFYRTAGRLVKLSIEAGVNMVDICDDYDGLAESLGYGEEAEREGVTVVSGLGWTPGLSNLLASSACRRLGGCRSIRIYWAGSAADSRGLAVILHVFHSMTGEVPQFIGGSLRWLRAGSGRELVEFPGPIGPSPTYYTGHPEPVSIPMYVRGVEDVVVKGGLVPDYQNRLVGLMETLGLITGHGRRRLVASMIHRAEGLFRVGGVRASGLVVRVAGGGEGIEFSVADRMNRLTGVPAAIGALWVARGAWRAGVFPPEAIIDPEAFLGELAARGLYMAERRVRLR